MFSNDLNLKFTVELNFLLFKLKFIFQYILKVSVIFFNLKTIYLLQVIAYAKYKNILIRKDFKLEVLNIF